MHAERRRRPVGLRSETLKVLRDLSSNFDWFRFTDYQFLGFLNHIVKEVILLLLITSASEMFESRRREC